MVGHAPRLTVGTCIMFVVFLNKDFRWFKYVCIKNLTYKICGRFRSLTDMSRDRNDQGRKVPWPNRLRPKQPDRIGQTGQSCSELYEAGLSSEKLPSNEVTTQYILPCWSWIIFYCWCWCFWCGTFSIRSYVILSQTEFFWPWLRAVVFCVIHFYCL